jgi:hypothetical protein
MDSNIEKKKTLKDKLIIFYNKNKLKIFLFFIFLFLIIISIFILEQNKNKKNISIAERYIQADLYLSSKNHVNAKKLFHEIILSKNKFYSMLALNAILENDLTTDKNKILEYFAILEKMKFSEENKDIISLKKALYLIKASDAKDGYKLLQTLIEKNSNLKSIAQDIIDK